MKKKHLKKVGALFAAVLITAGAALTMAGCGGGEETPAPEQTETQQTETEQAVPQQTEPVQPTGNGTAMIVTVDTKGIVAKENLVVETEFGEVDLTGIDLEKPMIALTFDDGPGAGTMDILETLQEHDAKATFFELGSNVVNYPEMTKKLADAGMQVASHTYNHPDLATLSDSDIKDQYSRTDAAVKEASGATVTAVRAPYGSVGGNATTSTPYPIILWSIDTLDWSSRDANAICNEVYNANVGDGDIILFHDIYESTAEAVATLVPYLKDKGFQMVTVDQMFAAKEIQLQKGGVYNEA